ncbi:MAG TPA: FAD-binding oxidoreductase [Candidatus Methylomirabilis sp.]|nr:FAD-binding oxidoreductase [Candidatus Methylomirabilis sp.]
MRGTSVGTGIVDSLRGFVGADHVLTGECLSAYRLGGATPAAGVRPGDEAEVSRILGLAFCEGLGVVPWGGGVHQCVGSPPSRYDLVLDLARLDRLIEHEPAEMTTTVEAGIRLPELRRRLETRGQFLPLDPPLADGSSLGGVLSANLSGPLRCRYGTARDLVLAVRVGHADGTITKGGAKVVKNATAYDITKLYLGAHGTLGVILEATLRLFPIPEAEAGWWLPLSDLARIQAAATRILSSHLQPTRVELLDEAARGACGGSASGPALMVSCAGGQQTVQSQRDDLEHIARESGGVLIPVQDAGRTWTTLRDFPWMPGDGNTGKSRAIWRGSVLPVDCAKAMHAVREAACRGAEVAVAANVAHGSLRGAILAERTDTIAACLRAARAALTALGGFLVVLDAPAAVREQVDPWGPPADGVSLMRRLKSAYDPKDILNPGRFVGGI